MAGEPHDTVPGGHHPDRVECGRHRHDRRLTLLSFGDRRAVPGGERGLRRKGELSGLILLSFVAAMMGALSAELPSLELRHRLGLYRPGLVVQATVYGSLAARFGGVAAHNVVLLIQQTVPVLGELFYL